MKLLKIIPNCTICIVAIKHMLQLSCRLQQSMKVVVYLLRVLQHPLTGSRWTNYWLCKVSAGCDYLIIVSQKYLILCRIVYQIAKQYIADSMHGLPCPSSLPPCCTSKARLSIHAHSSCNGTRSVDVAQHHEFLKCSKI